MVNRNASRLALILMIVSAAAAANGQVRGQQPIGGQQATGRPTTGQQRTQVGTTARPTGLQGTAPQRAANQPAWMPLPKEHADYLNQILGYWEHKTGEVQRYRCDFERYEYQMGQRGEVLKTYTAGKIQYAAPDKGLFKAEQIKHRTPPGADGKPGWQDQVGGPREHWICDGKSIFEFNYPNKQLIVRPLPEGMQGKQIAEGPLPFMFGAKASQIKARFWVRVVTPPNTKGEYHLEAIPRTQQDAGNFRELRIIISEEDFLPKAMLMFHPGQARTTYVFKKREVNWNIGLNALNLFHREFFEPALPDRTWKRVVAQVNQPAPPAATAPRNAAVVRPPFGPGPRQAQAPRGRQAPR